MNRPCKNKVRHGAKALPAVSKPASAQNVQNYDGRANTNAGTSYEEGQFRLQDVQGSGNIVHWRKGS